MKKKIIVKYLPQTILTLLFVLILIIAYKKNVLMTNIDQSAVFPKLANKNDLEVHFRFTDASDLLQVRKFNKNIFWGREPRYVVVADVNNDDFEDVVIINREKESKKSTSLNILINEQGKYFVNKTRELYEFQPGKIPNSAAVFDIDNDGWKDLVISYESGELIFYKNIKGKFYINPLWKIFKSFGDKRSLSVADFNNDGYLDIYLGSYLNLNESSINLTAYNSAYGGINTLLVNQNGNGFKDLTESYNVGDTRFTWTSSLADFNNDGYIDIININDFGRNKFFENQNGKFFKDSSSKLGERTDSFNMSGEVFDSNNNGVPEVYISNTNKFPIKSGFNRLLEWSGSNFKDHARELNIDACGWSWGVRAFDFELNNNQAIFVVTSPNWSSSQNFRTNFFAAPVFVKKEIFANSINDISKNFYKYNLSSKQRYCIFYKQADVYLDVSALLNTPVGDGGRSIAEIDFNLDGSSDFIIANSKKSATLLKGNYFGKNKWILIKLIGTQSNKDAIGSKVIATINNKKIYKYLFPTNGYHSQSTSLIKFGVDQAIEKVELEIIWPNQKKQIESITSENFNKLIKFVER